jgi:hypothetical protein
MIAIGWYDVDLPLMYQFGFLSQSDNLNKVVQYRSSLLEGLSYLPRGDLFRNFLNCTVEVFDLFEFSSVSAFEVQVVPKKQNANLTNEWYFMATSIDTTQKISVLCSILNYVNCTSSPNCLALGRRKCSKIASTCGKCLDFSIGDDEFSNMPCVDQKIFLSSQNDTKHCENDLECDISQFCNSFFCEISIKQCPNRCSNNGNCVFINMNTRKKLSMCNIFSSDCNAVCNCNEGYAGADCSLSTNEHKSRQMLRYNLLFNLSNIIKLSKFPMKLNDFNLWTSSLSSLTQVPDELSVSASFTIFEIVSSILTKSISSDQSSYGDTNILLDAMNTAFQTTSYFHDVRRLLEQFDNLLIRDIILGQKMVSYVSNSFRSSFFSVSTINLHNITIESPATKSEYLQSQKMNTFSIKLNSVSSEIKFSTLEIASKLYPSSDRSNTSSNYFQLRIFGLQNLEETNGSSYIEVYLRHNVPGISNLKKINFTSDCSSLGFVIRNFTCPFSGHTIFHDCSNKMGVLISFCPVLQPICNFSSTNIIVKSCRVTNYSVWFTMCSCEIENNRSFNRRALTSIEESTGILGFVAMSSFVSGEFVDTLRASKNVTSAAAVKKVLTVIIMFVVIWGCGIMLILFLTFRHQNKNVLHQPVINNNTLSLQTYINEIFPSVFGQKSKIHKLFDEVLNHHRYFVLFSSLINNSSDKNKTILSVIQLLTIQSLLCFLISVLYDLQSPSDDGSCATFFTEKSCLSKKSYFDRGVSYCIWEINNNNGNYFCSYKSPSFSFVVVFYMFILVSLVNALFMKPIDKIFDLLLAPVHIAKFKMTAKVNNFLRKASLSAAQIKFSHQFIAGSPSIIIPRATQSSRYFATTLIENIKFNQSINHLDEKKIVQKTNTSDVSNFQKHSTIFNDIFLEFKCLKASEREVFMEQWGLDSSGCFIKDSTLQISTEAKIRSELESVVREVNLKLDNLKSANNEHIGLELLHLFILDILGRETFAARIFQKKTEEDFKRTHVVTTSTKIFCVLLLVLFNGFFAYYSILHGFQKGISWQHSYLSSCISQLLVEIFLFETFECVWIQFLVPNLVASQVNRVGQILAATSEQLCSRLNNHKLNDEDIVEHVLNTPDYLFVSTNLAKSYPNLVESSIILSYHDHLPGELAKK